MDPCHVIHLAGDAWGRLPLAGDDDVRRRRQQELHGYRGRASDPLFRARRLLHTGAALLTAKQSTRLNTLFSTDDHVEVQGTWGVYQCMIAAYRDPHRRNGQKAVNDVIDALAAAIPAELGKPRRLGRTLKRRADDVLAYFDRPGTSNDPNEAVNGRLEHLRGSALDFRNLTHYIARSLLGAIGSRSRPNPRS